MPRRARSGVRRTRLGAALLAGVLALSLVAGLSACASSRTIEIGDSKKTVDPYGLWAEFAARDRIDPSVEYRLSVPNIALSVIFSETLVVPVILVGWYLWEPVGAK